MKSNRSGWLKIKMIFLLIVLALSALIGYQNKAFFLGRHDLRVDLYFFEKTAYEIPNVAFLAGFFAAGLMLAFILALVGKFKSRKAIKELNHRLTILQEENDRLDSEIRSLKAGPQPPQPDDGSSEADSPA